MSFEVKTSINYDTSCVIDPQGVCIANVNTNLSRFSYLLPLFVFVYVKPNFIVLVATFKYNLQEHFFPIIALTMANSTIDATC